MLAARLASGILLVALGHAAMAQSPEPSKFFPSARGTNGVRHASYDVTDPVTQSLPGGTDSYTGSWNASNGGYSFPTDSSASSGLMSDYPSPGPAGAGSYGAAGGAPAMESQTWGDGHAGLDYAAASGGSACYDGAGGTNYVPKWHRRLYWDYWKLNGIPSPWHSPGNMTHHVPYIAVPKNYYYFRPYNWFHIPTQQIEANHYGADPRNVYDNRVVFEGLYEGLE
jgi:hypothetical protein